MSLTVDRSWSSIREPSCWDLEAIKNFKGRYPLCQGSFAYMISLTHSIEFRIGMRLPSTKSVYCVVTWFDEEIVAAQDLVVKMVVALHHDQVDTARPFNWKFMIRGNITKSHPFHQFSFYPETWKYRFRKRNDSMARHVRAKLLIVELKGDYSR